MGESKAYIVDFFKNINWDHFQSMSTEEQDSLMLRSGFSQEDIDTLRGQSLVDIRDYLGDDAPPVIRPFWA